KPEGGKLLGWFVIGRVVSGYGACAASRTTGIFPGFVPLYEPDNFGCRCEQWVRGGGCLTRKICRIAREVTDAIGCEALALRVNAGTRPERSALGRRSNEPCARRAHSRPTERIESLFSHRTARVMLATRSNC